MMEIYLNEVKEQDDFTNYFKFVNHIASGAFGKVIQAIDLSDNSEIAVKIVDKKQCKNKIIAIKKEIAILQQLNHKNIVRFLGHLETDANLFIKMEHIKGGTLKTFMSKRYNTLTELEISIILKNLLEAVNFLHGRDITHRDIKPENVMFQDFNDLSSIKLIDFGLSNQDYDDLFQYDLCGTIIYMAPEQLEKRSFTKSVDIWSCGIVMYMLLNNGEHPIYKPGLSSKEYLMRMKNLKWKCINKVSQMGMNLLYRLLEKEPSRRYSVDKCLRHPWITRKKYDRVPITHLEAWKISALKTKFKDLVFGVIWLLGYQKVTQGKSAKPGMNVVYTNLLTKISHEIRLKYMTKRDKYFETPNSAQSTSRPTDKKLITVNTETVQKIDDRNLTRIEMTPVNRQSNMIRTKTSRKVLAIKFDKIDINEAIIKKTLYTPHTIGKAGGFHYRKESLNITPSSYKTGNSKYSELSTLDLSPTKKVDRKKVLSTTKTQEFFPTKVSQTHLKTEKYNIY
jgi:serine/threonine protein kinase